jgi:hypothetical protein
LTGLMNKSVKNMTQKVNKYNPENWWENI